MEEYIGQEQKSSLCFVVIWFTFKHGTNKLSEENGQLGDSWINETAHFFTFLLIISQTAERKLTNTACRESGWHLHKAQHN